MQLKTVVESSKEDKVALNSQMFLWLWVYINIVENFKLFAKKQSYYYFVSMSE